MSFIISGLPVEKFTPLFGLSDEALRECGAVRKIVDCKPGFPCRVTLEDAEPGETVLLLNYESHKAKTPYRSSYAIYVRERATRAREFTDELPPVLQGRPLALRIFDRDGMLIAARLITSGDVRGAILNAFENDGAAYIHAHNAAAGCFAAEIRRL
jgi:hypothetical protein